MEHRLSKRGSRVCGIFALCLLALPGVALSHSKTDVITLVNGNELSGEIKGLLQGRLSFGTDSLGTVQIEWKDVTAVNSDFEYEVRLTSGERYYGTLARGEEAGKILVLEKDRQVSVAVLDVVELRAIESSVADRFDIRLGVGYSYAKASGVGTFDITSELNYEDERGITAFNGRTSRTDQDNGSIGSNLYSIGRQFWTRWPQVVRWLQGSYEDNDELELDYRYTLGFGLGKAVVDTNRQSLIGYLGFQGASEKSFETESFNSVEGVLGANYALWRFDTPELELSADLTVYPGITESGRWRGNSNIRLSWEIINDFTWDITYWSTYDNQSQSGSDTDYGLSTGLGWEY